jgi:hypothetical protein
VSFIGRVLGSFFCLEQVLRNISIIKCAQGKRLFLDTMTQRGHRRDESGDRRPRAAVTEAERRLVYGGNEIQIRGDAMLKLYAAGLCAALVAGTAFVVSPADAQTTTTRYYSNGKTRVATTQRPRARVTVAPRSFLDAGTEVKPGDRKFLDYAFPAGSQAGYATSTVTNTGGKVGWDRSPLMNPSELPGGFMPY